MDNLGLPKGKLQLVSYDSNYKKIYNEEKKNLEKKKIKNIMEV